MAGEAVDRSVTLFVTANAPAHLKWRTLLNHIHLLDFAVTFLTREPSAALILGLDVTLVRETHEVWQVMHFDPLDRLIVIVSLGQFFDGGAICADNFVATHTGVAGRNPRRE
jgi:hypothetical protein